mgnify:CR=1 FL=1
MLRLSFSSPSLSCRRTTLSTDATSFSALQGLARNWWVTWAASRASWESA